MKAAYIQGVISMIVVYDNRRKRPRRHTALCFPVQLAVQRQQLNMLSVFKLYSMHLNAGLTFVWHFKEAHQTPMSSKSPSFSETRNGSFNTNITFGRESTIRVFSVQK